MSGEKTEQPVVYGAALIGAERAGAVDGVRVIRHFDLFSVSLVVHYPHEGAVDLSPERPICPCGVGYAFVQRTDVPEPPPTCRHCGGGFDPDDPPPPMCRVSSGYCSR
jgi:hypothetical protein